MLYSASPSYIIIWHSQNQEIDVGAVQLTRLHIAFNISNMLFILELLQMNRKVAKIVQSFHIQPPLFLTLYLRDSTFVTMNWINTDAFLTKVHTLFRFPSFLSNILCLFWGFTRIPYYFRHQCLLRLLRLWQSLRLSLLLMTLAVWGALVKYLVESPSILLWAVVLSWLFRGMNFWKKDHRSKVSFSSEVHDVDKTYHWRCWPWSPALVNICQMSAL